nr:hemagglutinin repeat-containing protein [Burkholderia singularis]
MKTGAALTAGGAGNRGNSDGDSSTWTNAHVTAGNQLAIQSGGDPNLKGGGRIRQAGDRRCGWQSEYRKLAGQGSLRFEAAECGRVGERLPAAMRVERGGQRRPDEDEQRLCQRDRAIGDQGGRRWLPGRREGQYRSQGNRLPDPRSRAA